MGAKTMVGSPTWLCAVAELIWTARSYVVEAVGGGIGAARRHRHARVSASMRVLDAGPAIRRVVMVLFQECSVRPGRRLNHRGDCPEGLVDFERRLSRLGGHLS